MTRGGAARALFSAFRRDRRGASAIEFALVATPFVLLLLFVLQIGIYFMMQIGLNNGVLITAEGLRSAFGTGTTPVLPSSSALKSQIASGSTLIANGSALAVDIQPMSNLNGAVVPVTDGTANYGSANTVLALRAKYTVSSVVPGIPTIYITSTALVRRQSE